MRKLIYKKIIILSSIIAAHLISGCFMKTSIKGEFILENSFKMVKEFDGDKLCLEEDRWFLFDSTFFLHENETYELSLKYKNGSFYEFRGQYKIYAGDEGHSGQGYFVLDNESLNLTFQNSFYLLFQLPSRYSFSNSDNSRILCFQRW